MNQRTSSIVQPDALPAGVAERARARAARTAPETAWVPTSGEGAAPTWSPPTASSVAFVPTQRTVETAVVRVSPSGLRAPLPSAFVPEPSDPGVSRYAVLALVLAVLGLAPLAVATGHLALGRLSCSQQRGRWMAVTGLVLGYAVLAGAAAFAALTWLPGLAAAWS